MDDPYWVCDTEVKTITVKAGETASVSFQNRYIGKAKIIKTLEDPDRQLPAFRSRCQLPPHLPLPSG